jgi:very-short-patch-repair endonuclease
LSKSKTLKEKWDSGEFDYQRSLLSKRMKDGGGAKARKACGGRKTRPEMIFESYLKDKGIDYKYDEMVGNHATDFVVGKYAIEIDGNYWHNLENQKVKDEEINKMLTDNGYKVIRFWENEVLKDDNKIKNFLNQIGG